MAARALNRAAVPAAPDATEQQRVDALLACAGALEGTRAFVAAINGLDLFCTLIRRGCMEATCLRPGHKADRHDYDLVLVPDIACLGAPEEAIRLAHRALRPAGRVVMGFSETVPARKAVSLTRWLRLNGFREIQAVAAPGYTLIQAEAQPGRRN